MSGPTTTRPTCAAPVSPDGIAVGDTVRIEPAGFGPGSGTDQAGQPAASVTVVAPDQAWRRPVALRVGRPRRRWAQARRRRARRPARMPIGTISAIADGTLTLTLADGTDDDVLTDASTTFWQEEPATAHELIPGASVRVRPSFGGPRRPAAATWPQDRSPRAASRSSTTMHRAEPPHSAADPPGRATAVRGRASPASPLRPHYLADRPPARDRLRSFDG